MATIIDDGKGWETVGNRNRNRKSKNKKVIETNDNSIFTNFDRSIFSTIKLSNKSQSNAKMITTCNSSETLSSKKSMVASDSIQNSSDTLFSKKQKLEIMDTFKLKLKNMKGMGASDSIQNSIDTLSPQKSMVASDTLSPKKSMVASDTLSPQKSMVASDSIQNSIDTLSSKKDISKDNPIKNVIDTNSSVISLSNIKYDDIYKKFHKKTSLDNVYFFTKKKKIPKKNIPKTNDINSLKRDENIKYIDIINHNSDLKTQFDKFNDNYKKELLKKIKDHHENVIINNINTIEYNKLKTFMFENIK